MKTAVDDDAHAWNRQRSFRDIGRENHFARGGRFDGKILLLPRQLSVQRGEDRTGLFHLRANCLGTATDLAHSGEKDQDIAGVFGEGFCDRVANQRFQRLLCRSRKVFDFHGMKSRVDLENGRIGQKFRDQFSLERRRHHDQLEVRARGELKSPQIGNGQIAVEMALMEFVENHRMGARKLRIRKKLPHQHSFGQETQARARRGDILETKLIAYFFPELGTELFGHATGGKLGGNSAGFEDDDVS